MNLPTLILVIVLSALAIFFLRTALKSPDENRATPSFLVFMVLMLVLCFYALPLALKSHSTVEAAQAVEKK